MTRADRLGRALAAADDCVVMSNRAWKRRQWKACTRHLRKAILLLSTAIAETDGDGRARIPAKW